jgi:hypothetical protein
LFVHDCGGTVRKKSMKRHWYLILILLVVGSVIFASTLIKNHVWIQTNSVKVFYDGEEATNSRTYISSDGDLMAWVQKGDEKLGVYVISFKRKRIGTPYPSELLAAFPWGYFIRSYPMNDLVDIGTEKSYPYAHIAFGEDEDKVVFSFDKRSPQFVISKE